MKENFSKRVKQIIKKSKEEANESSVILSIKNQEN